MGLWGLFAFIPVFVRPLATGLNGGLGFLPLFAGPVLGPSRLAASLVLAIMILPTISAVSRDVLRAIPGAQREAALALGATHWEMIWQVLVPSGLSGLLGAIILGLGPCAGRDDRRHDGDRQQPGPFGFAATPGLHHGVDHRQ